MTSSSQSVLPVVLGGDAGVYGIGRCFHEALGGRSLCLSSAPVRIIERSAIFDVHRIADRATDDQLLAELLGIAAAHPDRRLVLMANHDLHSVFVARNRQALEAHYALPFPSMEVIETLTDKAGFARACKEQGIATPATVVVDMRGADQADWTAPEVPFDFPVVAKASRGDAYDQVEFEGKRKIWFIESRDELDRLWKDLRQAGFRDSFLVQELIPGDNTAMRSLTAYVDSAGEVTLIGSARVLLEDHAPTMIGNPVAMITEAFPALWDDARRLLTSSGYRGFANFDVKVDPRDGRAVFFEVNPRIGRNNWYMSAAGHNPVVPMMADLVDGRRIAPQEVREEVLYSMVPDSLLLHYLREPGLAQRVRSLVSTGRRFDPLMYREDKDPLRELTVRLQRLNHVRKFRRYYPEPTDRSY
ncbi:carboxylate--amine ligase [Schaalia sp. 19OD2882]|uniref:carboxylate--amine ligase n=1 Tax=Schaalia sp. 19OD2882 TaxID=2794089 RepID=UPI001C1F1682|nr:carboxylate--amine ligase [Schaalia sp. 19OD2882]QWW20449.1 carboxylate--amine ligase [Schaalia sp. 19OD2882]